VDRGQPGVARGDAVSALALQGLQESGDAIGVHIGDVQGFDWALRFARSELQQQHQGIPVTMDRMHTDAA
jgi:hypothetical protein